MKPSLEQAFNDGAGNFISAANLALAIQLVGATIVILFYVWLLIRTYDEFGHGKINERQFLVIVIRGLLILMILLWIFVT